MRMIDLLSGPIVVSVRCGAVCVAVSACVGFFFFFGVFGVGGSLGRAARVSYLYLYDIATQRNVKSKQS